MTKSDTVVGIDGSPGSLVALHWAEARPEVIGRIRPVHVWAYPWWSMAPAPIGAGTAPPASVMTSIGHEVIAEAVADIDPDRLEDAVVGEGSTSQVLLDEAERADLLVVGTRERSAMADRFLGSVSNACVSHAVGPVVVVTVDAPVERVGERIVVGFDGSANSAAALDWALGYATHPDDRVEVVTAWTCPHVDEDGRLFQDPDEAEQMARSQAEDAVAASANAKGRSVTVQPRQGDPRSVLTREASTAQLLVLGARGRSTLAELLVGSVTAAITHQPPCPLAVIR